jgi:hypothetical protein
VRVVLEQALDLPGRQDALQALGEGVGWYVFVSLEIAGNFASMSIDPGQVFEIQLATLTA